MRLLRFTGFHSSKPVFINPEHVVSVSSQNAATEVILSGSGAVKLVLESLDDVVARLTTADL